MASAGQMLNGLCVPQEMYRGDFKGNRIYNDKV